MPEQVQEQQEQQDFEVNVDDLNTDGDPEVDFEDGLQEEESDEQDANEEDAEHEGEEESQDSDLLDQEKEEKTVPLKALEAERKKWQERLNDPELAKAKALVDLLKQTTGKDLDTIQRELEQAQVNRYIDSGVDPQMAQHLVIQQRQMSELNKMLAKQKRDIEIAELKNKPLFKDIELYREEVETYADRTGMSLKNAFLDLYGETLYQDMERQIEQRVLANIQKRQSKKVDTTQSSQTKAHPRVKLTADEEAIARAAGMTAVEYAAMKKISTPDQYQKFKAKKK